MNGTKEQQHSASIDRAGSLSFSDSEADEVQDDHPGDYSTRLGEVMSDEEELSRGQGHEESDDDEGFFYNGVDSEPAGTYREQLRDVLGPEHEEDDVSDAQEVEHSLLVHEKEMLEASMDDEARVSLSYTPSHHCSCPFTSILQPADASSDLSPTASSGSGFVYPSAIPKVVISTAPSGPAKPMRPFLHPSISRLRSTTPQGSRTSSVTSVGTIDSKLGISTPVSHFSALSPTSSQSNLPEASVPAASTISQDEREVFRWSQLRNISDLLYQKHGQKASSLIGAPSLGSPTVLAANGLVCIGTDTGKILVFDFKQNMKCVCGSNGV